MIDQIGQYSIEKSLGKGSMGEVFLGYDHSLRRWVAVKALPANLAADEKRLQRFREEAIIQSKFHHPNIATVFTWFEEHGQCYIVMEYVEGEALDSLLVRRSQLTLGDLIYIFCEALRGVEYAHQGGVIHRDLKPANIMVTAAWVVKLMDFGVAREIESHRMTQAGMLVGTPTYMAPELFDGANPSVQTDIYALGVLLFEMVSGQVPFSASSVFELMKHHASLPPPDLRLIRDDLPPVVVDTIEKALQKRPEDRFQSASEWLQILTTQLEGMPRSVSPGILTGAMRSDTPPPMRTTKGLTRETRPVVPARPRWPIAVIAISSCVVLIVVVATLLSRSASASSTETKPPPPKVEADLALPPTIDTGAEERVQKASAAVEIQGLIGKAESTFTLAFGLYLPARSSPTSRQYQSNKKQSRVYAAQVLGYLAEAESMSRERSVELSSAQRAQIAVDRMSAKALLDQDFSSEFQEARALANNIEEPGKRDNAFVSLKNLAKHLPKNGKPGKSVWPH